MNSVFLFILLCISMGFLFSGVINSNSMNYKKNRAGFGQLLIGGVLFLVLSFKVLYYD